MKNMEVTLVPLTADEREQFILDNQWAFKHGALMEFGVRDEHMEEDGEIISRKTIEDSIDGKNAEALRILENGKPVGGAVVKIDQITHHSELELLFVTPQEHSRGVGFRAWKLIEERYPDTVVWKTCTPYFDKRNIHFYINKCGFHAVEFVGAKHPGSHSSEGNHSEGPDEMFHFEKRLK